MSGGSIKAEIQGKLDTSGLVQLLKATFAGMNIKEEKIENICQLLARAAEPFPEWNRVIVELEALALHSIEGPNELPETPTLNRCSFIESERTRIAQRLDPQRWLDLSVAEFEFNPKFQYCTSKAKDEYIAFSDASAGQQATALLTVLLNQSGAPLIIDQPEDDIDSKLFREIVERVWHAKSKRQVIFATHSANFNRWPSIHGVSRSLPGLDTAFEHLDVGKALRLVFCCLTGSARFGGSRSIEDDFLGLW